MSVEQIVLIVIATLAIYLSVTALYKWIKEVMRYGRREAGAVRAFITILMFVFVSLFVKMVEFSRTSADKDQNLLLVIFHPSNMILASIMPMAWLLFLLVVKLKERDKDIIAAINTNINRQEINISRSIAADYKHNTLKKINGASCLFDIAIESLNSGDFVDRTNHILIRRSSSYKNLTYSRIKFLDELARVSVLQNRELKISYCPLLQKDCRSQAINEMRILIDRLKKWESSDEAQGQRGRLHARQCEASNEDYILTKSNMICASLIDGDYLGYSIDDPKIVEAWRKKFMLDYWKECSKVCVSKDEMEKIFTAIEFGELQYEDHHKKTQDYEPFEGDDQDRIIGLDPRDAELWRKENFIVTEPQPVFTFVK